MTQGRDPEAEVELGPRVRATPQREPAQHVVAVRMPPDLLERVATYARTHGLTTSEVLRQGAARLVDGGVAEPVVSGLQVGYGSSVVQGPTALGAGRSLREERRDAPAEQTTTG